MRIADVDHYGIDNYESFYGFVAGMLAGNYDIMGVYVDSILKIGNNDLDGLDYFYLNLKSCLKMTLKWCSLFRDESTLPESVKKYI